MNNLIEIARNVLAVIFDMDGLMFNTEDVYKQVMIDMGKKRGKVLTVEVHQKMMGKANHEDIRILLDFWGLNEDVAKVANERRQMYVEVMNTNTKAQKGLFNLLNVLEARKIEKAIATGTIGWLTEKNLELFNLSSRFKRIISGEMVTKGKPNPEIYLLAVKSLGLEPEQCLALEDSVNGVMAAKSAGCKVFAVPNRYSINQNFSIADGVFESLADIANLFIAV